MSDYTLILTAVALWLSVMVPLVGMFWAIRQDATRDREIMRQDAAQDRKRNFELWKENQERWVACNLRIEKILTRMEASGERV